MSFIGDFFGDGELADIIVGGQADIADLGGQQARDEERDAAQAQEDAANDAISEFQRATGEAQGFLSPYGQIGQRGADLSSFLGDSQAQFDWLKNNPLFQLSLDNANQNTNFSAAAGGRLNAGDTLQQLSNNTLLSAQPLLDAQRRDIGNLLNVGTGIATTQANTALGQGSNVAGLIGDIGNVQAAQQIAAGNRRAGQTENAAAIFGTLFGSDPKLKTNIKQTGYENGFKTYSWDWNDTAKNKFNLTGSSYGVMFPEVLEKMPNAAEYVDGFGHVNYSMIGVKHG
jgi:hypothetical protein